MPTARRRRRGLVSKYAVHIAPEQLEQLKLELVDELRPKKKRSAEFSDFAARFIVWAHGERQKPSSLISKASALRLYLSPRFAGMRLEEINDVHVLELKRALSGRSPKTVNNVLTVLRKMLRLAARWGELEHVPVIDSLKVNRPPFEFYDFEQYEQLLAGARREGVDVHVMVLLAGDAGLRMGELLALELGDVDLRRREIFVQRSEWNKHVTAPKGGTSRAVPMTVELRAQLERLVTGRLQKTGVPDPLFGSRLLQRPDGSRLSTEGIRTWLRRAQRAAGLAITGRLHVLRHTFCSHLAMRGAPPIAIKNLAGHTTLATTERYMHLTPAERSRTIGLLDQGRAGSAAVATRESL